MWSSPVAVLLIVMRLLDLYWLLMPAFHPDGIAPHVFDLLLPVAIGLVWVGWFVRSLGRMPLLARNDPRFPPEALGAAEAH